MSLQRKLVIGACVVVLGCGGRERPALDAGTGRDAATVDASVSVDAGRVADAGTTTDAGETVDAGQPDAGGALDSGVRDAGVRDSGVRDAGSMDGGSLADAGASDAGPPTDGGPCLALPATGSLVIDGALGATPSWYRPDDSSACPSAPLDPAELHAVSTYVFCGDGGSFRIRLDGIDSATAALTLADPYLVVYAGPSIPTDPLQCLAINDDEPAGAETLSSEITSVTVPAGTALTVAATSYYSIDSGDGTGTFQLTITRL